MQRNISTIWWRFGGFVMSLIGTVAWTHDAKAAWVQDDFNPGIGEVFFKPETGQINDEFTEYKAVTYDYSGCNFVSLDWLPGVYRDLDGIYPDTGAIIVSATPWFCAEKWWLTADDDDVADEISSILGDDWNSLSGTETWTYSSVDDDKHLRYTNGYRLGDRVLEVYPHPGTTYAGDGGNTGYVLADYGYAYQNIYRIIGCASGYTVLNGASEDSVVTSLDGIYCTSAGDSGTTPVIPAACTGIPNDNNLITIYDRGSDGCFFWEADTSTHNLYDATGYFKYTTNCSCWDDGSRICS